MTDVYECPVYKLYPERAVQTAFLLFLFVVVKDRSHMVQADLELSI